MARLAQTEGLTEIQQDILSTVRDFVDKEILPYATELEHKDEFPEAIVEGMKEMGLFGLMIPEEYGGLGESLLTYALVVEEIARGWMSVSGVINTHFIVAYMLRQHGTEEQKQRLLPKMATGEVRGAFSMSEPGCGSDVSAIKTKAVSDGDEYVIDGQKMWLTNGARAGVVATLVKTDEGADSVYKNMTTLLVEKEPGLRQAGRPHHPRQDREDGLQGRRDHRDGPRGPPGAGVGGPRRRCGPRQGLLPDDGRRRGRPGQRRRPRLRGHAARLRARASAYAQQRKTFGKPIADHQAIAFKLAEMATKVEAAHLMMVNAARLKDAGKRNDVEAGMAKLLASRVRLRGHHGVVPHPRRLRLLQGVRDRAPVPRGAVPAHRRGHVGDPEDDHQPRPAEGLQALTVRGNASPGRPSRARSCRRGTRRWPS